MGNVAIWKPASSCVYSGYFLMKMLKENGITKKMLVKNKSRFSPVLHNYYIEANIQEGFDKFLQTVLKQLN